jgi:hypothetical protein
MQVTVGTCQYLLMATTRPDPERRVAGISLGAVVRRLASRIVEESGGSQLQALADIRAAAERQIRVEILLLRTTIVPPPSWREIGDDLGVSAQAAHRKYA